MPILKQEPSVYPPDLLDGCAADDPERRWWAVYTMARQEKALARQLLSYRIPFYLPLVQQKQYSRGRCFRSYLPVFTGYVFLFGSDDERVQTLTTNRISRIMSVVDGDQLRKDLWQVRHLIESNAPLTVESRLSPGQRVRIKNGPLVGLEGTIITRRSGDRLLIAVNYLQQGVSVQIDDYMVEPV